MALGRDGDVGQAALATAERYMLEGKYRIVAKHVEDNGRFVVTEDLVTSLTVRRRLRRQVLTLWQIELGVEDRIASGVLVDRGRAMADPLACDEDWQLDVDLQLAHFEGRGVLVAHEVVNQSCVVACSPGPSSVGHPCGLHNCGVIAHVVDDSNETMVENRHGLVEDVFHSRDGRPARLEDFSALLVDLGLLFGRECHLRLFS